MKPNDMASLTCSCGRPSEHESGSCVACVYKAEVDSLKAQLKHCRESRADEGLSAMEELVELRADVDRLSANDELQKQSIVALLAQVKAITTERDEEAMLREKYWLDMETAKTEAATMREALVELEDACREVASWSEECVDYSHPARVKARAAIAGKEKP